MKKKIYTLIGLTTLLTSMSAMGQNTRTAPTVYSSSELSSVNLTKEATLSAQKTTACTDTVRYPLLKENVLGNPTYNIWELWTADNEAFSQTYELNGSSIAISGVEYYGLNSYDNGTPTVTVQASIYNVDASNNPTTLIGSGTQVISDQDTIFRYINFATPITVTGDYAVVIEPISAGGIFEFVSSDATSGQVQDEGLSRTTSTYYPGSGGNWVSPANIDYAGNGTVYDFEAFFSPIISYTLDASFTTSPAQVCEGDMVTFTNTSDVQDILGSKMYTYTSFQDFFGISTSDSTYAYDMDDGSAIVWDENPTHTFIGNGTFDVTFYNLGGLLSNCLESTVQSVVVDPIDDPSFTFNNFCLGAASNGPSNVATSGGNYAFNPAPGDGATINASTGEISNATLGTTYTVEYTTNGPCPASSTETVTVQSNDDASFTYNDFCAGDTPVPSNIATAGGTFAFATPPGDGATIDGSTGEVSNFTIGTTYDVEYTTPAGACQASSTETVTVNALPTVTASGDQTICDGDQTTITASGASTYSWDNSLGAGASHSVSPANTTTYMVTGQDANGCEDTDDVTITVNPAISATETITPSSGSNGAIQLSVNGGDGTYTFAWDNGETTQDISGLAPGDYTVIITDGNGCTFEETYTVQSTVGIEENDIQTLSMYPNPSDASVTIAMNESSFTYEIMNTLGQIITSGNAQQEVLVNTGDYDSGVYFVKVKANNYEKTLRLVVKH